MVTCTALNGSVRRRACHGGQRLMNEYNFLCAGIHAEWGAPAFDGLHRFHLLAGILPTHWQNGRAAGRPCMRSPPGSNEEGRSWRCQWHCAADSCQRHCKGRPSWRPGCSSSLSADRCGLPFLRSSLKILIPRLSSQDLLKAAVALYTLAALADAIKAKCFFKESLS